MKKVLFSLCFLLAFTSQAWSRQRSLDEIKAAASQVINKKGTARSAARMGVMRQNSQLTVVGYNDGGFAVVANDDRFPAVMGYSDTKFTDNMPPALEWWLTNMEATLSAKAAAGETVTRSAVPEGYQTEVPEMLTTRWDQSTPYWNLCPTYVDPASKAETHYLTGCVATAMAQVMYYHKHPEKGTGRKVYRYTPDDGSAPTMNLAVDFGSTTYDWANMLPEYVEGAYNDAQAQAVATLMYHCGVAVDMNYRMAASGALLANGTRALREYFGYDEYVKYYVRTYMNEKEWMDIVYKELNDNCPILYGGADDNMGGHCFVLDGYDAEGKVHVNWGWSGDGNGYFDIATLHVTGSTFDYTFDDMQELAIVRLPDDDRYNATYNSLWALGADLEVRRSGTTLNYSTAGVANLDVDDFTGEIALLAVNVNGGEPIEIDNAPYRVRNVEFTAGFQLAGTASIASLGDGTYRIYLASKSDDESAWQPVRSHEDVNNSNILTIEGNKITIKPESDSSWTSGIEGVAVESAEGDGVVRVYNASGTLVYSAKASEFNVDDVPAKGLIIVNNGGNVTKVMK